LKSVWGFFTSKSERTGAEIFVPRRGFSGKPREKSIQLGADPAKGIIEKQIFSGGGGTASFFFLFSFFLGRRTRDEIFWQTVTPAVWLFGKGPA